jgi:DNA-binding LacI/PurR family transcriptional regulator
VNIGEIARRAGVSRSTVSYVISGKRPVSERTRQKIQQVIADLDYRPSAMARALAEGRTRTIGLVIPPANLRLTPVQLTFVASVVEAATRYDLDVLLSPSGVDHDRSFERLVSARRVDGIILMEIRLEDARVRRLQARGMPFVTIGRVADADGTCWVDVDYERLIRRCVRHLADLGHRDFALINRSAALLSVGYGPARRALTGFTAVTRELGLAGEHVCCDDDRAAGEVCMADLLRRRPGLTAVVTINEAALPAIQHALAAHGLTVPRDVSVIGVAERQLAEDLRPPLTSADVPAAEMAARAVELLCDQLGTPDDPLRHLLLAPPISLRRTTAPMRPRCR